MLGVRGGGCAGFAYDWQLMEDEPQNCEIVDLNNGYKLYIDNMSPMYPFGLKTVDLKKDVFGTVLEVPTPHKVSRGCGESVNFDMDVVESNMSKFNIPCQ